MDFVCVTSYCSCKAASEDDEPDPLDYCDGDDDPATDPYDDPIDLEFFEAGSGCGSVQSKQVTQLRFIHALDRFVLDVRSSKYSNEIQMKKTTVVGVLRHFTGVLRVIFSVFVG